MNKLFDSSKKYKLIIELDGRQSFYVCSIIYEDDLFIKILDKKGKEFTFNKNIIKSFREALNG
jgi:hypothetical protein